MTALQRISIVSSTLTVTLALTNFVTQHRRQFWVQPKFPLAASSLAIGCLLGSTVISGTMSFLLWEVEGTWKFALSSIFYFPILTYPNILSMFHTIFVLCIPCTTCQCCYGRCCKFIRSSVHVLLTGTFLGGFFYQISHANTTNPEDTLTLAHLGFTIPFLAFCSCIHLIMGLLLFSGLNVARLFAPIVYATVFLLKKVSNCCCFSENYRSAIHNALDKMLQIEEDNIGDPASGTEVDQIEAKF